MLHAVLHEQIGSKTQANSPSVSSTRIRGPLVVAVVQKDFLPLMRVRDLANVDTSRWSVESDRSGVPNNQQTSKAKAPKQREDAPTKVKEGQNQVFT